MGRIERRFWSKTKREGECWNWTGARQGGRRGLWYGTFWINGTLAKAHRAALLLAGATVPANKVVMHRCDNPLCVRPSHLRVGTQAENMQDAGRKGRLTKLGEKNPHVRLTDDTVRQIRRAYENGEGSHAAIAKRYGISAGHASNIISGRLWAHVED